MIYHLPQFPLQLVVFPGEQVNLHIFEDRYKNLIHHCRDEDTPFGIPPFVDEKVQEIGSKMLLKNIVREYDDGRMDISIESVGLYRIHEFHSISTPAPYPGAMVEDVEADGEEDPELAGQIALLIKELFDILKLNRPQKIDIIEVFSIVHKLGLSLEEEYEILSSLNLRDRQDIIVNRLEKLIPAIREAEYLRRRIQMNGHFKHIIPPDLK